MTSCTQAVATFRYALRHLPKGIRDAGTAGPAGVAIIGIASPSTDARGGPSQLRVARPRQEFSRARMSNRREIEVGVVKMSTYDDSGES